MCRILNAKEVGTESDDHRVYVARPSKWGNPFFEGIHGSRPEVIAKYAAWVVKQPHLMKSLPELRGHDLICWCAPLQCHAEILRDLANQ